MPENNNRDPNEKLPGETPEGNLHFNPGNMAGKKPQKAERATEEQAEKKPSR
jgi:hypothetical protein